MKNSDVYENRLKQVEDLSNFLESKEIWLSELLAKTGWTLESLIQKRSNLQCPHNPNHWIAPSAMEKHVKTCSLVAKGYSKEDLEKEPPCSNVCYEKSTSVVPVHIDKNALHTVIARVNEKNGKQWDSNVDEKELPETMDRYITEFSTEERLAIYDYAMEKAKAVKKETDVSVQDLMVDFKTSNADSEKPKTHLEILAEKRDYKRRRQSYRAKNVHVTRKSYTEVMKEVIGNQMQYLMEIQKEEEEEQKPGNYRVQSDESIDQKASDLDEQMKSESDDSREERPRKKEKKHHHHHKHKRSHSKHREKHKKKSK